MRPFFVPFVLAIVALLSACDTSSRQRAEALQADNLRLSKELADLKRELEEVKFGATRLLSQAEQARSAADWAAAKKHSEDLLTRHPSSPEAQRAKEIAAEADAGLAQVAKMREAAEAQRVAEERRQKEAEERRLATALSKMSKKVDTIENVTWYRDRSSPQYNNYNGFFLYIGKRQGGAPWLRFRVQYNADDWLFIESFLVVADGRRFEYPAVEFERDNDSEIWEWYDAPATERDIEMVKAVVAAKSAVVRLNGRQYRRDRNIGAAEKVALQNVLDAYQVLGGT